MICKALCFSLGPFLKRYVSKKSDLTDFLKWRNKVDLNLQKLLMRYLPFIEGTVDRTTFPVSHGPFVRDIISHKAIFGNLVLEQTHGRRCQ
ncbi:hypothetical protein FKM82_028365 [Ascaphus truei]